MAKERSFSVSTTTEASVETLFAVVSDAARWREWTFLSRTYLEQDGVPAPDGVGAIRRFGARIGPLSRERVTVYEPPHRFGYELLKGMPMRGYRSLVTFEPIADEASGTRVTWASRFEPIVPGVGAALNVVTRRLIAGFLRGLVREAEARSRAAN